MVKIREIFTSVQGEGSYIGYKQLFIRFCGCNLNCKYCDTDFRSELSKEYSLEELTEICKKNNDCFSVSLTGGEPLLSYHFLQDFLPESPLPVYLETNGTLYNELEKIIDYVDYISADIKLPSCSGLEPQWANHEKFFEIAQQKELFAKVVFDSEITEYEIQKTVDLCHKYGIEIILQPKSESCDKLNEGKILNILKNKNNKYENKILSVDSEFMLQTLDKFLQKYSKVRLIPQVHKFIDVE